MGKYNDWTRGEDEALLNILGGTDVARAVLRGERKLAVEEIVRQQPVKPPLVGTVVKALRLNPYKAKSVAEAIKIGGYDGVDSDIVTLFANDEVGLTKAVNINLVQFDRNPEYEEMLAWAKANGGKKPIMPKHLLGIGIQHRDEQRNAPILGLGSVRRGGVLVLVGNSGWRGLGRFTVRGRWDRVCLVGFLGE